MTDEHASEPEKTTGEGDREPPPGLPEIRDEAADTPRWVPLLGLSLLVLSVFAVALTATLGSGDATDAADEADVQVDDEPSDDD